MIATQMARMLGMAPVQDSRATRARCRRVVLAMLQQRGQQELQATQGLQGAPDWLDPQVVQGRPPRGVRMGEPEAFKWAT